MLDAAVPLIFKDLSADDSDLREAAVSLLLDILKLRTGEGRRVIDKAELTENLNEILEARRKGLTVQLASADPCDRDAIATEMAQIEEAVTILSTPIPDSPQNLFKAK